MNILSILSGKGFIMANKELAHATSLNASVIFGQLCSSYESFSGKKMTKVRDGKEFFFLTSETLENETTLSYKMQLKATKELEEFGLIETAQMGVPSKKHFHITNKIVELLLSGGIPRYAQKEELTVPTEIEPLEPTNVDIISYAQKEELGFTKGTSLQSPEGSAIKENNKKEKFKEKKDIKTTTSLSKEEKENPSSSPDKIIQGFIDKGLQTEFPNRPFDEIKFELLKDKSLVIKTEKQYESMLRYRLENWKPKQPKKTSSRPEIVPDWFEKNKEKKEVAAVVNPNIDEDRRKLLEELGIQQS